MSRNVLSTILLRFFIVVHKFHYYYALWRNAPFLPLNNKNRQPIMPFAVLLSVFPFFRGVMTSRQTKPTRGIKVRSHDRSIAPRRSNSEQVFNASSAWKKEKKKRRRCTLRARWSHFQQCWYSATLVLRNRHCRKSWLEEDAEGFSRSTTVECQNVTYSLVELSLVGGREKKKIKLKVCLFFETVR